MWKMFGNRQRMQPTRIPCYKNSVVEEEGDKQDDFLGRGRNGQVAVWPSRKKGLFDDCSSIGYLLELI